MVGFEQEGACVVDENKVAAVDLCGREVVHGDDKRARTLRTAKIGVLKVVEGSEALSSARRRLNRIGSPRPQRHRQSPVRPSGPPEQRSGRANCTGKARERSRRPDFEVKQLSLRLVSSVLSQLYGGRASGRGLEEMVQCTNRDSLPTCRGHEESS